MSMEDREVEDGGHRCKRQRKSDNEQSKAECGDIVEEFVPLELSLTKSESFLELIESRLSKSTYVEAKITGIGIIDKKLAGVLDVAKKKMKASNFPAYLLIIGTWKWESRYEGDLVAKCYYSKRKLVWEVLQDGLKRKIEIQWSQITALRATLPENKPGTLEIVLERPPIFFKETDPVPRRHTNWQSASDFTGGQASSNRKHFLQCHCGYMNKHLDNIIKCDPRLNKLSQLPEIVLISPYFELNSSAHGEEKSEFRNSHSRRAGFGSDIDLPYATAITASSMSEVEDPIQRLPDSVVGKDPSLGSGQNSLCNAQKPVNEMINHDTLDEMLETYMRGSDMDFAFKGGMHNLSFGSSCCLLQNENDFAMPNNDEKSRNLLPEELSQFFYNINEDVENQACGSVNAGEMDYNLPKLGCSNNSAAEPAVGREQDQIAGNPNIQNCQRDKYHTYGVMGTEAMSLSTEMQGFPSSSHSEHGNLQSIFNTGATLKDQIVGPIRGEAQLQIVSVNQNQTTCPFQFGGFNSQHQRRCISGNNESNVWLNQSNLPPTGSARILENYSQHFSQPCPVHYPMPIPLNMRQMPITVNNSQPMMMPSTANAIPRVVPSNEELRWALAILQVYNDSVITMGV